MVTVNDKRMFSISDARANFSALIAETHSGRTAHIVKGSEVVAHLVPPNARIIDEEPLMTSIALAMLNQETDYAASVWRDDAFHGHAGDIIGRFFAWIWNTDPQSFLLQLARYHELLCIKLKKNFTADEIVRFLDPAMEVSLHRGENRAACQFALAHAPEWSYFQLP